MCRKLVCVCVMTWHTHNYFLKLKTSMVATFKSSRITLLSHSLHKTYIHKSTLRTTYYPNYRENNPHTQPPKFRPPSTKKSRIKVRRQAKVDFQRATQI